MSVDDGNAYHPDIFFIKKERFFILDAEELEFIKRTAIEILSKSTAPHDKGDKDTYERCGVREYWLADPVKRSVEVYAVVNQRYKLVDYKEGAACCAPLC